MCYLPFIPILLNVLSEPVMQFGYSTSDPSFYEWERERYCETSAWNQGEGYGARCMRQASSKYCCFR